MSINHKYDYIICGAGPVGLTLSWLLAQVPQINKILLIERDSVIGGCHRVNRITHLFSEHGPRIYSTSFKNVREILHKMGISFDEIFTSYKISNEMMSKKVISSLSFREIFLIGLEYFKLILNPQHGRDTTVLEFMEKNNFSEISRDKLNRLCRLTDGAAANRYSLLELLSGFDQHFFYEFLQPSHPNDVKLFPEWQKKLQATGKITIMLNTNVENLLYSNNQIQGVIVKNAQGQFNIISQHVILAFPPENAVKLIDKISWGMPIEKLIKFDENSRYDPYIPVVFHWDTVLPITRIWGFPETSWGVVSILLSDFMKFNNPKSKTVISTCITLTDSISPHTGKTANQSTKEEVIRETFHQLSEVYGGLPPPTNSILSAGSYRTVDKTDSRWNTQDSAFLITPLAGIIPQQNHPTIKGLAWVGTHNGYSSYNFTSMESAVANAISYFIREFPAVAKDKNIQLQKVINLSNVIRYILAIVLFIILISLTKFKFGKLFLNKKFFLW